MKKQEFLSIVRKQIRYVFVRDAIEEELKQHLNDSMEALIEEGLPWQEAEEEAVRQMGDPVEVGVMLNKEHKPLLGYLLAMSRIILFLLIISILFFTTSGIDKLVVSRRTASFACFKGDTLRFVSYSSRSIISCFNRSKSDSIPFSLFSK